MKCLVIGGTLFIGRALVAELLKAGHDVAVLHRRRSTIWAGAWRTSWPTATIAAGREARTRRNEASTWSSTTCTTGSAAPPPAQVEATARACGNHLQRYIFMSSVAAYGDGLNHHEGDPLAPDDHPEPYVRNKAMSERALFRLHQRNGLPVVTFRPPFVYGPGQSVLSRGVLLGPPARRPPHHHARRRPPPDAVRLREGSGGRCHAGHGRARRGRPRVQHRQPAAADAGGGGGGVRHGPPERTRTSCASRANAFCAPAAIPWVRKLYFGVYFDMPPITGVGQGAAGAEIQTASISTPDSRRPTAGTSATILREAGLYV